MTSLTDFIVTDDVDDALASQYNKLLGSILRAEISNATTMSGTVTLADNDTAIQRFNCNGANRIVKLPAYAITNHPYLIINAGASNTLDVQNNAGVSLLTIPLAVGATALVIPDGTAGYKLINPLAGLSLGHLFGLTLSNGTDATNDINIAAGKCRNDVNTDDMSLASVLTKQLDATWAVGTNQGGLDTGSIANTTYHIWLIKRSDTGVVDALFSASATAPSMPANYDQKRRIGSIVRSSGAIIAFVQDGDNFMWVTPILDVTATNPGTAAVTRTLTLPTGIRVQAKTVATGSGSLATDEPGGIYLSDLSLADVAASVSNHNLYSYNGAGTYTGGSISVMTNTSAQIRSRVEISTAATTLRIQTHGWIDTRGRLA